MSSGTEYLLEILTTEENNTSPYSPYSTKLSLRSTDSNASSRHLLNKPRHLEPRTGKTTKPRVNTVIIPSPVKIVKKENCAVREMKQSWTFRENAMYLTEERLIFIAKKKGDWEKWQKAFKSLSIEIVREEN